MQLAESCLFDRPNTTELVMLRLSELPCKLSAVQVSHTTGQSRDVYALRIFDRYAWVGVL